MEIPVCREKQFQSIIDAIDCGIHLIAITGPMSSGKTTVINKIIETDFLKMNKFMVFCDSQNDSSNIYSKIISTIKPDVGKLPKSFRAFYELAIDISPSVIFIDSFDLLNQDGRDVFDKFYAACSSNLLPNLYFVFCARSLPSKFITDPSIVYCIDFPPYKEDEFMQIVTAIHPNAEEDNFERYLKSIIKACVTITKDVRDIIYITYQMHKKSIDPDDPAFSKAVVEELREMKKQVEGRVNNLPRLTRALLLGSYIAMKTSALSDLMRLTRSSKRNRKGTTLTEEHEFVPLSRVLAITKSLIFNHMDNFEFDFAVFIQLQNLVDLGLLEIRGDIRGDPKAKCLATQSEVQYVADTLYIEIDQYVC